MLLIADRHDNIGMDKVARAIGDAGGATVVFDAGDDTSVGPDVGGVQPRLGHSAFEDYDRFGVAGNHDHGTFVRTYLADHGWTMLDGTTLIGPAGVRLLGVDDPRSSGLGNWRDETGLSFAEVGDRLADEACEPRTAAGGHDPRPRRQPRRRGARARLRRPRRRRSHPRPGRPDRVDGRERRDGWSYTTGTAGGAAYAIAVGSKPRRPAGMSLITYRDGRPVGHPGR